MPLLWFELQCWWENPKNYCGMRSYFLHILSLPFPAEWKNQMSSLPQTTQGRRICGQVTTQFQHTLWGSHEWSSTCVCKLRKVLVSWHRLGWRRRSLYAGTWALSLQTARSKDQAFLLQWTSFNILLRVYQRSPQLRGLLRSRSLWNWKDEKALRVKQ